MVKTVILSLPLLAVFTTILVLLQSQMIVAQNAVRVVCQITGKCAYELTNKPDPNTVCTGCKSCRFKDARGEYYCCHKVFTDPRVNCPLGGWKAADYVGNIRVIRQVSEQERNRLRKRGNPCSVHHFCPRGEICDTQAGQCRDAPKDAPNNAFLAAFGTILAAAYLIA